MEPSTGAWYKATIIRRFFAVFIDGIIISVVGALLSFLIPKDSQVASIAAQSGQLLLGWIYAVYFISQKGATPGKMAMKIQVVKTTGGKLSIWDAILREVIGKFISGLAFGLGYLWAFWDKDRQAWHDKIAGTYAVTKIPNDGKKTGCLMMLIIGAVLFIPIIAIISAVVVMIINPLELTRTSRDAVRISNGLELQNALFQAEATNSELVFCPDGATCMTNSTQGGTAVDGSGWIPVAVSSTSFQEGKLPLDPINSSEFNYVYCSDGKKWEIEMPLESEKMKSKMLEDKGDKDNRMEFGSDLTLCK